MKHWSWIALALLVFPGCDSTGPEDEGSVSIRFRGASAPSSAQLVGGAGGPALATTITGTNGTLSIESVHMVVGKFKLEGAEEACPDHDDDDRDDDDHDDDDDHEREHCGNFKAAPFLLSVPLDGDAVEVKTANVPAGVYDELEFEVEDADVDDDDDREHEVGALRAQMLALHADWPREASMVVVGTFTPTGGAARPFRTFVEAEIEVELDLDPPLTVEEDGSAELTVLLDPRRWFRTGTNAVLDLSAFSGASRRLKLEVELENGFTKVEIERH